MRTSAKKNSEIKEEFLSLKETDFGKEMLVSVSKAAGRSRKEKTDKAHGVQQYGGKQCW